MYNDAKTSTMFTKLKANRSNWETNWDTCAKYTLPQLYLEDSVVASGVEPEDLVIGDSIGAEGLSNFISQLLKITFPTQGAFFRVAKLKDSDTPNLDSISKSKQQAIFRRIEEEAMAVLYRRGLHAKKMAMIGMLVCLGNVAFHVPRSAKAKIQVFDLNNVVIKRTLNGELSDLIIKEPVEFRFLSDSAKATLHNAGHKSYKHDTVVDYYTHVRMDKNNKLSIAYSVNEVSLNTPTNFTPRELCEYQVADLDAKRGANYAVGIVQQYISDIHKANVYADTATDTAVAGSLVNWAISPKAHTRPEEWEQRVQGQPFAAGRDDISAIIADVGQHLTITKTMYDQIVQKLQRVFLMSSAIQRDAERVTAQEIRMIAQRLEETHSGLYALIAEKLQRPLAHLGVHLITDSELVPFKAEVEIAVVTAMEAQSRGAELDNMMASLGDTTVMNSINPLVAQRLRLPDVLGTIFNNRNVDADTYIKTEEEFQAEQRAAAEQEAALKQQGAQQPSQSQVFQGDTGLVEDIRKPLI